jgi:uncharacterized protein YbjT (DUF2867 family)
MTSCRGSSAAAERGRIGLSVRTGARTGADVRFDWGDPATHSLALADVDRVYLVAPVLRTDFAEQVSSFLDLAHAAGVRHVTYLSAFGMDQAPPHVAHRAVELDLIARGAITHAILRPAWFMQNFSETFLKPVDGVIAVPTGDGAEAFVDADDIAAVAAATLASPAAYSEVLRVLAETVASGDGSRPNNDVENVTRRPPSSFADFARRTAQTWA